MYLNPQARYNAFSSQRLIVFLWRAQLTWHIHATVPCDRRTDIGCPRQRHHHLVHSSFMSQPELPPIGHAVSGAVAASISNTIVYPVPFPPSHPSSNQS